MIDAEHVGSGTKVAALSLAHISPVRDRILHECQEASKVPFVLGMALLALGVLCNTSLDDDGPDQ